MGAGLHVFVRRLLYITAEIEIEERNDTSTPKESLSKRPECIHNSNRAGAPGDEAEKHLSNPVLSLCGLWTV